MPVAGKGTRLRPHTHATPKALIRVAGKPIISHIIEEFEKLDVTEVIFIIGHLGDQIRDYIQDHYDFKMTFIRQLEYNGLGHAIHQAKKRFKEDEDVMVLLGDIIFRADLEGVSKSGQNQLGVMEVDEPQKFGIVTLDEKKRITSMIEKPEDPPTNLAITGMYYFKSSETIFSALDYIIDNDIRTRNEFQLTDAMRHMMESGEDFSAFNVPEWYDCGSKPVLLETNEIMLAKYGTTDHVHGSIIIPPVFVAEGAVVKNSIVGPNVSVSREAQICNSIVKNSVLGVGSTVENCVIEDSLIGDYAYLHQAYQEFNIGNDSEIIFTDKG